MTDPTPVSKHHAASGMPKPLTQWFSRRPTVKDARQSIHIAKNMFRLSTAMAQAFWDAGKIGALTKPNQPHHPATIQKVCTNLCVALNVEVHAVEPMPTEHALWVSNHVSWLDIPVVGSQAQVFFTSKAEVAGYPVIGRLARAGGSVFVKRGSGDSIQVREQISALLKQKLPIIFFPEATTTDGRFVRKIHGKLLPGAIETGTPVQPIVLAYVNSMGLLDNVVPFIGDMGLPAHIMRILAGDKVTAHILPLPAIDTAGHDLASLTALLQATMQQGLHKLHQHVLKQMPDLTGETVLGLLAEHDPLTVR